MHSSGTAKTKPCPLGPPGRSQNLPREAGASSLPRARPRVPPGGSRPQGTFFPAHFVFCHPRKLLGLGENSVCFPSLRKGLKPPAFHMHCLELAPDSPVSAVGCEALVYVCNYIDDICNSDTKKNKIYISYINQPGVHGCVWFFNSKMSIKSSSAIHVHKYCPLRETFLY